MTNVIIRRLNLRIKGIQNWIWRQIFMQKFKTIEFFFMLQLRQKEKHKQIHSRIEPWDFCIMSYLYLVLMNKKRVHKLHSVGFYGFYSKKYVAKI